MSPTERARVVFQPELNRGLKRGISQVARAVKPAIGPIHRQVVVDRPYQAPPECLDRAGVIARRITGLPDRTEDAGAMLLRGLLWKVYQRVGDGAGTAAVIFESMYNDGLTYIAAGGNPVTLRSAIESGVTAIDGCIERQARPSRRSDLERYAANALNDDPELAAAVIDAVDLAGVHRVIEFRKGLRSGVEREYVEGRSWMAEELLSRASDDASAAPIQLEQVGLLIADLPVETPGDVEALFRLGRQHPDGLVIFVDRLSKAARNLLEARRGARRMYVVRLPGGVGTDERMHAVADLAALTGATPLLSIAGHTFARAAQGALGSARRCWLNDGAVGIVGGGGDPRVVRKRIDDCVAALNESESPSKRRSLLTRIGKLQGGIVTLRIGGWTDTRISSRMTIAEDMVTTLRAALEGGFVPGGGAALLASRAAVRAHFADLDSPDQRAATHILYSALEAPARAIRRNAGHEVTFLEDPVTGHGVFDVRTGREVDAWEAGILDVTTTLQFAVRAAVGAAAQALTVGALVQHRKPVEADVGG